KAHNVKPVPGHDWVPPKPPADPSGSATMTAAKSVTWPAAGTVEVALLATGTSSMAAGLPIWLGARGGRVTKARVAVLDRPTTKRAGVSGLLLRVSRSDSGRSVGTLSVRVNYHGFRDAYGGGWASRLHLVELPECALTDPTAPACQGRQLATS